MQLIKTYVKHVDGGNIFWIDSDTLYALTEKNAKPVLIKAYDDNTIPVFINFNNVIYIKSLKDEMKADSEATI